MSNKIYDLVAPYYRSYSEKKMNYLESIDKFIINNIPKGSKSLLDLGAGDGFRGTKISEICNINYVVLNDNSEKMIEKCKEKNPTEILFCGIEELKYYDKKFDIILCLWNVLGHLESEEKRLSVLKIINTHLDIKGFAFVDVNNRYNGSSYGYSKVLLRMIIDFFSRDIKKGDASYFWDIDEQKIPGYGHLFTPQEIEKLINVSGLKINKRVAVNYLNGNLKSNFIFGQLLYKLSQ